MWLSSKVDAKRNLFESNFLTGNIAIILTYSVTEAGDDIADLMVIVILLYQNEYKCTVLVWIPVGTTWKRIAYTE